MVDHRHGRRQDLDAKRRRALDAAGTDEMLPVVPHENDIRLHDRRVGEDHADDLVPRAWRRRRKASTSSLAPGAEAVSAQ